MWSSFRWQIGRLQLGCSPFSTKSSFASMKCLAQLNRKRPLTLQTQTAAVSNCKGYVLQHGAAGVHALYLPEGARVVEVYTDRYMPTDFADSIHQARPDLKWTKAKIPYGSIPPAELLQDVV
jgi:hypothetical protein